jgi:SAM-dependent methyltransferase
MRNKNGNNKFSNMADSSAWEILASISKDNGEYFPDLDSKVNEWNKEEENFVKEQLNDNTKVVLDLGCGDGRALSWLKEKGFEKLYGFDISKTCIERSKERLGKSVSLTLGNYKDGLPYKMKFDRILLMGNTIIADLEDPVKLLKNIKSILKDDGLLYITCWNGDFLTKEFVEKYYFKLGVLKIRECNIDKRTIDIGGIKNKWLIESEIRNFISDAGLKIVLLKKASIGFLCIVSK